MAKKIATAVKKNAKRAETRVHEVKERIAAAKIPPLQKCTPTSWNCLSP